MRLLDTSTYVTSSDFTSHVVWLKNGHQNDLMLRVAPAEPDARPTERATCAIVGKVLSANRAFLEPHGNYNPNFEKTSLEMSKVQFLLVAPTSHPDFETDFATSLDRIETIQRKAIKEGPSAEHFIVSDGINRAFKQFSKKGMCWSL